MSRPLTQQRRWSVLARSDRDAHIAVAGPVRMVSPLARPHVPPVIAEAPSARPHPCMHPQRACKRRLPAKWRRLEAGAAPDVHDRDYSSSGEEDAVRIAVD